MKYSLSLLCLLLMSETGLANDWHFSPYAGFDGQYTFIKAEKDNFGPAIGRFRIGSYIYQTVGFDMTYSLPLRTDTKYGVSVSLKKNYTFNIRWESPPENFGGLSAYILTGYAVNELDIKNQDDYPGKETYRGFNLGIGFKQLYYDHIGLYCEYNYQYFKDSIRISGISLGAQIEF